jgi:hypothetical protein
MRILVTGARGKADAVTIARLLRAEHELADTGVDPSFSSYVVIENVADLFTPPETAIPPRVTGCDTF